MKQFLPVLFLIIYILSPFSVHASVSFTIGNPVREGDYYIVDASLSGIASHSAFVFGMFTHTSNTDYFGFTWGQKEEWVEYRTTNKDFITSNLPILLKDTPQKIWIKPNFENSGFKGSGDYYLKLKRYTGNSDSSSGESNTLTVYLTAPTPIPTETPSPTSIPSQSPSPTLTPTSNPTTLVTLAPTRTPTPTQPPTKTPSPSPTVNLTKTVSPVKLLSLTPSVSLTGSLSATVTGSVLGTSESVQSQNISVISFQEEASLSSKTKSKFFTDRNVFVISFIMVSIAVSLLYFRITNR